MKTVFLVLSMLPAAALVAQNSSHPKTVGSKTPSMTELSHVTFHVLGMKKTKSGAT